MNVSKNVSFQEQIQCAAHISCENTEKLMTHLLTIETSKCSVLQIIVGIGMVNSLVVKKCVIKKNYLFFLSLNKNICCW